MSLPSRGRIKHESLLRTTVLGATGTLEEWGPCTEKRLTRRLSTEACALCSLHDNILCCWKQPTLRIAARNASIFEGRESHLAKCYEISTGKDLPNIEIWPQPLSSHQKTYLPTGVAASVLWDHTAPNQCWQSWSCSEIIWKCILPTLLFCSVTDSGYNYISKGNNKNHAPISYHCCPPSPSLYLPLPPVLANFWKLVALAK